MPHVYCRYCSCCCSACRQTNVAHSLLATSLHVEQSRFNAEWNGTNCLQHPPEIEAGVKTAVSGPFRFQFHLAYTARSLTRVLVSTHSPRRREVKRIWFPFLPDRWPGASFRRRTGFAMTPIRNRPHLRRMCRTQPLEPKPRVPWLVQRVLAFVPLPPVSRCRMQHNGSSQKLSFKA